MLKRPEGKTLEFKRDLSSPDPALRAIVAFANTAGGVLLVGVEDETGRVRGVANPLDLEERLANLISDNIDPRLVPELEILPWRKTHVLAVQVFSSPSRPHHFIREGRETGVYVRVGSTNRRADKELVEELRRSALGEAFDERPMPSLNSEAVDFRAASESFAPLRKLRRNDLETLRLVALHQGRKVPTVGVIILFGPDRERHFPDAWIQTGRFAGTDKSKIVDRAEIHSYDPSRGVFIPLWVAVLRACLTEEKVATICGFIPLWVAVLRACGTNRSLFEPASRPPRSCGPQMSRSTVWPVISQIRSKSLSR